jgi:hypothetical protein
MKLSPLPCYLVPLKPNILLNTPFSNTLSLRSSLNVSAQVSHQYKTTDKVIALYLHVLYNKIQIRLSFIRHEYVKVITRPLCSRTEDYHDDNQYGYPSVA